MNGNSLIWSALSTLGVAVAGLSIWFAVELVPTVTGAIADLRVDFTRREQELEERMGEIEEWNRFICREARKDRIRAHGLKSTFVCPAMPEGEAK